MMLNYHASPHLTIMAHRRRVIIGEEKSIPLLALRFKKNQVFLVMCEAFEMEFGIPNFRPDGVKAALIHVSEATITNAKKKYEDEEWEGQCMTVGKKV